MIKPMRLQRGDTVATISLSWGGAGDEEFIHRYEIGKKRLEDLYGLKVVEMAYTLKGSEYLSKHPEDRAKDFMNAFKDDNIKAIISNIGGDDTIRLLPYIDYDVIRNNPKIFMGYSDTTTNHFMCYKAGLISYHGPSVLAEFAENVNMHGYTKHWFEKILFTDEVIGEIPTSEYWTSEYVEWFEENKDRERKLNKESRGYELLQGKGKVQGKLLGGCIEILDWLRGTEIWPDDRDWDGAILFLETSEDKPTPDIFRYYLRCLSAVGVIDRINGIVMAKPMDETYYEEYKQELLKVISEEAKRTDLPILYNLHFGHTSHKFILPMGVEAEIDCDKNSFSILESGVK